jgi:hypothetical protein
MGHTSLTLRDTHLRCLGQIMVFIEKENGIAWGKQNKNHYCFLKFNPYRTQIILCRWGQSKRPAKTDGKLWHRINVQTMAEATRDIQVGLDKWVPYWDELRFDTSESEKSPRIYPVRIDGQWKSFPATQDFAGDGSIDHY